LIDTIACGPRDAANRLIAVLSLRKTAAALRNWLAVVPSRASKF
jgi:hypothetical protein